MRGRLFHVIVYNQLPYEWAFWFGSRGLFKTIPGVSSTTFNSVFTQMVPLVLAVLP